MSADWAVFKGSYGEKFVSVWGRRASFTIRSKLVGLNFTVNIFQPDFWSKT